ncbi:type II secretion system F family protein [Oceanobacillus manasiensis]|uniref:type II secretion system F family protein n=1 Tax=Oceanobacillus manasiensis TaxID=586413 RepID=UPI0005A6AD3B|nr:type II secretion system F family protein [Oceanobacillus manasiensis]
MVIYQKLFIKNYKPAHETQVAFLSRLSRLLSIGYALMPALERTKWEGKFVPLANTIIPALAAGATIDEAFEKANFHPHIVNHLYLSRTTGNLEVSIKKAADSFRDRIFYFKKLKQITRYPLLLLFIFCILLFLMKQIVLPSFTNLFQSGTASSTLILFMLLVDYIVYLLFAIGAISMLIIFLWPIYSRKITTRSLLRISQTIPFYRGYCRVQTSMTFAAHFSSLLKTGISYLEVVNQMSKLKKQRVISYYASFIKDELSKGYSISSILSTLPLFDKKLSLLFNQDTSTEHLVQDLDMFTEILMEDMKQKALKIITFIQPVFFLVLAGFIIFIYISIMWPMYELIKTI